MDIDTRVRIEYMNIATKVNMHMNRNTRACI